MKTIGIIGGTTWVSTVDYYKMMNQKINRALGKNHSARVIMISVDFQDVMTFKAEGREDALRKLILDAANKLEYAGSECLLLGANTIHMMADFIRERIGIPLIHIGEETAKIISSQKLEKVALLGTKVTMEQDFYRNKLSEFGIETIIPNNNDREFIHKSIFEEFSKEIFSDETRQEYTRIIADQKKQGAEGVILGCTEIPLLLDQKDFDIPLFNTTEIHVDAAVRFALDTGNDA
ncbi:MAG: aspartate/glutamate racemase family protein [Bacteroidales bacterium]|jgi:aspartate racemase|nr:aspartate/glutamate racemase family protein [Bacteroidales bacterium]